MLTGKELPMKREVFAKNTHFIGRSSKTKVETNESSFRWKTAWI